MQQPPIPLSPHSMHSRRSFVSSEQASALRRAALSSQPWDFVCFPRAGASAPCCLNA
jgi:hypothetical protein